MTIQTMESRREYVGTTATDYPIGFPYIDPEDLVVTIRGADGIERTMKLQEDYTVSGDTVHFQTAPSNQRVVISRNTARTQTTQFEDGGRLRAAALNAALDKLTLITQELGEARVSSSDIAAVKNAVLAAESAAAVAEEMAQSAGLLALGRLEFPVPRPENDEQQLQLELEFSQEADFSTVESFGTMELPEAFRMFDGENFSEIPAAFMAEHAGRKVVFLPKAAAGIVPGEAYYVRSRWTDGDAAMPWSAAVYALPRDVDELGGEEEETGGLDVGQVPDLATGLVLSASGANTLVLSAGYGLDSLRQRILSSADDLEETLSGLRRNTEYSSYLIGRPSVTDDGTGTITDVRLFSSCGTLTLTKAWRNPAMFHYEWPEGYAVDCTRDADGDDHATHGAWRAFDGRYYDPDTGKEKDRYWVSQAQGDSKHTLQMIFDRPKKITKVKVHNAELSPYPNAMELYVLTEEPDNVNCNVSGNTNWELSVNAITGANTAGGTVEIVPENAASVYGIRLRILSTHSNSNYVRLGEVEIDGFDEEVDESAGIALPDGFLYYRKIGVFRTDNEGNLIAGSIIPHAGVRSPRVWLSEPLYPRKNSWIEVEHGLTIDPLRARAEVLAVCVTPDKGYETCDFAVNLCGADSRFPLTPALGKTNVALYLNAALVAMNRDTGAAATLNPECWALYLRIFY